MILIRCKSPCQSSLWRVERRKALLMHSGSRCPLSEYAPRGQPSRNQGKNKKQQHGQNEILESGREIASMPNRKDADVVGCWRGQDSFSDQVGLQKSSPQENH